MKHAVIEIKIGIYKFHQNLNVIEAFTSYCVYRTYVNWYGGYEHITSPYKQHLSMLENVREFPRSFLTTKLL